MVLLAGIKTYFILGRKSDPNYGYIHHHDISFSSFLPVIVAPASSPPKLLPQARTRVLSCNSKIRPHYLQVMTAGSLPEASNRIKASSLPSILNSDNDNEEKEDANGKEMDEHIRKSPTSLTGGGLNISAWKYSARMFKTKSGMYLK